MISAGVFRSLRGTRRVELHGVLSRDVDTGILREETDSFCVRRGISRVWRVCGPAVVWRPVVWFVTPPPKF